MLRLSVLDQSPVRSTATPADAIRETLALAQATDRLGFHRYWLAEHHSTPALAGPAPEVLIPQVAAVTTGIRVGSGGVMLQHYSALKVAESFRVLETLHPGRIDLGIGRAPGSDQLTARALAGPTGGGIDDFPQKIADVLGYLHGDLPPEHPHGGVIAMPSGPSTPEVWLLGSSDQSAAMAAHFGTGFSFAHFINADGGASVTRAYTRAFKPSAVMPEARASVAVFVVCAPTEEEAHAAGPEPRPLHRPPLHRPQRPLSLGRRGGGLPVQPPRADDRGPRTPPAHRGDARPVPRPAGSAGRGVRRGGGDGGVHHRVVGDAPPVLRAAGGGVRAHPARLAYDWGVSHFHPRGHPMSVKRINAGARMSGAVVNGNTVYLAGQVAEGATVKAQTEAILKKIDDLLGQAGSSKANLLSTVIYLSDIRTFDEMNAVWDAWVSQGNTPARATVEARLANPKYLVEIMVVAAV